MSEHDHDHTPITNGEEPAAAVRARALEELLVEKGVLREDEIHVGIDWLVSRTPADGARLVARAWVDAEFKRRLLADARSAALELGLDPGPSPVVVALENTETLHHMIVCTLCSCYPRSVLGYPPYWYKSAAYRARAVREPRALLAEFGTVLPAATRIQVVDSTADYRWMVLPLRPSGTEGWDEDRLAAIVRAGDMVGVTQVRA
jgi:nitrile hydratase subunit alpha